MLKKIFLVFALLTTIISSSNAQEVKKDTIYGNSEVESLRKQVESIRKDFSVADKK